MFMKVANFFLESNKCKLIEETSRWGPNQGQMVKPTKVITPEQKKQGRLNMCLKSGKNVKIKKLSTKVLEFKPVIEVKMRLTNDKRELPHIKSFLDSFIPWWQKSTSIPSLVWCVIGFSPHTRDCVSPWMPWDFCTLRLAYASCPSPQVEYIRNVPIHVLVSMWRAIVNEWMMIVKDDGRKVKDRGRRMIEESYYFSPTELGFYREINKIQALTNFEVTQPIYHFLKWILNNYFLNL